jgi:hypothetical protein
MALHSLAPRWLALILVAGSCCLSPLGADIAEAAGDKSIFSGKLPPIPGSIKVEASIAGAELDLDDNSRKAEIPAVFDNVPAGEHVVRLQGEIPDDDQNALCVGHRRLRACVLGFLLAGEERGDREESNEAQCGTHGHLPGLSFPRSVGRSTEDVNAEECLVNRGIHPPMSATVAGGALRNSS